MKLAKKVVMTDFQANYFIITAYPAIYMSSKFLNGIKILTLPYFLIYLLVDP